MRKWRGILLSLAMAGCDSATALSADQNIEMWCEAQSALPHASYPGIAEGDADSCSKGTIIWNGTLRCMCDATFDCPNGLVCRDGSCVPENHCTFELYGISTASKDECTESFEQIHDQYPACQEDVDVVARCLREEGPFCTTDQFEAQCSIPQSGLTECVLAASP